MRSSVTIVSREETHGLLNQQNTLMIAIGNCGRNDDGLGWAFADQLEDADRFLGKINSCYQLQVEDAELIAAYPRVIFVDACESHLADGYSWEVTPAQNDFTFTTHALTPEAVLFLCQDLYQKFPKAYTLKIQGSDWALKIGLSDFATENLDKALGFFNKNILDNENG